MDKTEDELKEIEDDLAYWQELADLLGWQVVGFTFKNSALFETSKVYNISLTLRGGQRDDIVRAIKNGL